VRDLVKQGAILASDLRIRFYGSIESWLHALIQEYGLNKVVELHGPISRQEAIERQRESQVLLLLPWDDPGHHSAKLFEYFAAARPVLAVGGSLGVLTQALEETQSGVHALSKAELREFLLNAYAEYKKYGRVSYSGKRQAIERYSHPEMARGFAGVLDSVVQ
jgi:glycosyltransferase involved in cell wall biosynthesis